MKLSELKTHAPNTHVVRDGAITGFGLLGDDKRGIFSPYFDSKWKPHLTALKQPKNIVTRPDLAHEIPEGFGLITVDNPSDFFWSVFIAKGPQMFLPNDKETVIDPSAKIHPRAWVAEKNVHIGARSVIGPNVSILERVHIGEDVRIGANTAIGGDGFEFKMIKGHAVLIPHFGGIRIEDRATIKTNVSVDWALFGGETRIGEESVIDNLVHVAHNVQIGKRCQVIALALLGGSSILEDDCRIGPNATVSNAIRVGKRARVTIGAVVTRDVPDDGHVTGNFAIDHAKFLNFMRSVR